MKRYVLLLSLILLPYMIHAQCFTGKYDQKLQAGFNFYGYGMGIKASYDFGLSNAFSVGGGAVFYSSGEYHSGFFLFGRGDYHFQDIIDLPKELDVYAGLELGVIGKSYFGLGGHLGGRYDLGNLYIFLEVGNNGAAGIGVNL